MPICPQCDVAYLVSENHVCAPRHPWWSINTAVVALLLPVALFLVLLSVLKSFGWTSEPFGYLGMSCCIAVGFALLVRRWPEYWQVWVFAYIPSMVVVLFVFAISLSGVFGGDGP